jgi:hypothetical protein
MLLVSIVFISFVGTLFHFLYDISNHNKIVGLFGAVNESTWEHIKIALTATIIWGFIDGFVYGININYFFAKFVSLVVIIILMPFLFYGYKILFKWNNAFVNILIFYVVISCSQYLFYYCLSVVVINYYLRYLSCIGILFIFGCYMVLTLMPIKNFLFKDPITNKYGYNAHFDNFSNKNNINK